MSRGGGGRDKGHTGNKKRRRRSKSRADTHCDLEEFI